MARARAARHAGRAGRERGVGQGEAAQPKFNVFAAASLNKAFPAMVPVFKKENPQYKNVKFVFNFQGTDTLVAQIEQGAPADVFAGASTKYGTKLYEEGLIDDAAQLLPEPTLRHPAGGEPGRHHQPRRPCHDKADYIAVGSTAVPIGTYTSQTSSTRWSPAAGSGPTTRRRSWPRPSPASTSPRSSRSSCSARWTPASCTERRVLRRVEGREDRDPRRVPVQSAADVSDRTHVKGSKMPEAATALRHLRAWARAARRSSSAGASFPSQPWRSARQAV